MATLTGINGSLRYRGRKVAKVRQFDISMSKDALEDTCVGGTARTYVPGLTGATGSATILLDPTDDAAIEMLDSVSAPADKTGTADIEFVFDERSGRALEGRGFLTSANLSVSVGDVQSASVSFQFSGSLIK